MDEPQKEENEEKVTETQTEGKTKDATAVRGKRDIVEKRTAVKVTTKKHPAPEKKQVEIVAEPSSKEGDDFDVGW